MSGQRTRRFVAFTALDLTSPGCNNDGEYFFPNPRGNVFRDGRFHMFTSNRDETVGRDFRDRPPRRRPVRDLPVRRRAPGGSLLVVRQKR